MTGEDFAGAAGFLDEAVTELRGRAIGALDFHGDPGGRVPRIHAWLESLAKDPSSFHHGVPPIDGLVAAQAWRLAFPETVGASFPQGAERTDEGWQVVAPTFWFGDVEVPGGLELRAPLVVLGSLRVDGLLDDGDVFSSHLAVAGDLRARAIATAADHLTLGNVDAAVIWCFTNDGILVVGGDIAADLFVPAEHAWVCDGELRARVVVEAENDGVLAEQMAPWLPAGYVRPGEADEPVDVWRVLEEAAAGSSPVLDAPRRVSR